MALPVFKTGRFPRFRGKGGFDSHRLPPKEPYDGYEGYEGYDGSEVAAWFPGRDFFLVPH